MFQGQFNLEDQGQGHQVNSCNYKKYMKRQKKGQKVLTFLS